jgi:hypothetical protein
MADSFAPSMGNHIYFNCIKDITTWHKKDPHLGVFFGGLYWTRTSDPVDVNDVLYQLSQQTRSIERIINYHKQAMASSENRMQAGITADRWRIGPFDV